MFKVTDVEITYLDGSCETVCVDQRDAVKFETWAMGRGMYAPPGQDLARIAATLFTRVCAWSAQTRQAGTDVEWEEWDKNVLGALVVVEKVADPTGAGSSAS